MKIIKCQKCGEEKIHHAKNLCNNCYRQQDYIRIKEHLYYLQHRDKEILRTKKWTQENKDYRKIYDRQWIINNRDKDREIQINYRNRNRDKVRLSCQQWNKNNKKYYIEYERHRRRYDMEYKILSNLRNRLTTQLKRNKIKKSYRTIKLLDCTIPFFKEYIEKQFKIGMSWENYGTLWHLDHIIPCAHFILSDIEQQKLCFHYTNYQPLWREENLSKGSNILEEELIIKN